MKGNRSALKYQRINLTEVILLNIVTLGSSALLLLQSGLCSQRLSFMRSSLSTVSFLVGCSDLVPVGPGVYERAPAALQSL